MYFLKDSERIELDMLSLIYISGNITSSDPIRKTLVFGATNSTNNWQYQYTILTIITSEDEIDALLDYSYPYVYYFF